MRASAELHDKSVSEKRTLMRELKPEIWNGFRQDLWDLFQGKCAYCERLLYAGVGEVDHYRPVRQYWWLAYDWNNLLLACQSCLVNKSNRFPVAGVKAEDPNDDLSLEQPLLLNPTDAADSPGTHLYFEHGHVVGLTERGRATIHTLALNSNLLVDMRLNCIRSAMDGFHLARLRNAIPSFFEKLKSRNVQFLAATRQELLRSINESIRETDNILAEARSLQEGAISGGAAVTIESEDAKATADYRRFIRRIERVTFTNFKSLASLTLDIPQPAQGESWLMLLGENGVGKSSILQGIALALMGEQHANSDALDLDASRFHRNQAKDETGSVEITLTNLPQPIRLEFQRGRRTFRVDPPEPKVLLLGYGSTRLLPRRGLQEVDQNRYIRIKNLFDPTAPLNAAEKWLCDTTKVSDQRFDEVAAAIRDSLLLPESADPKRENGKLEFHDGDSLYRLEQLSDGYQSVTAMVADIAFCVLEKWDTIQEAEGVVLIDEIEVHLHPRWKMTIVERLRRAFPRLCFIVTTHDPLCLRGLYKGEIVVLRKDGSVDTDIPDLDGYRADQLLTSPLFDLTTTRGARTSRDTERYAELLRKPKLTKEESAERIELEDRIAALTHGERIETRS